MTGDVVTAAARALSRRAVAAPAVGAVLLCGVATPVLDDAGWPAVVLHGVSVLLAVAAAAAVDEPEARLLDASPTSFARRVLVRLLALAALVVPLWSAAAWWTTRTHSLALGEQAGLLLLLVASALAVSAALRRWTGVAEPAVLTGPVLVAGLLLVRWLLAQLPEPALSQRQLLGVGIVVTLAALAGALRDPATAAQRRVPGRR